MNTKQNTKPNLLLHSFKKNQATTPIYLFPSELNFLNDSLSSISPFCIFSTRSNPAPLHDSTDTVFIQEPVTAIVQH